MRPHRCEDPGADGLSRTPTPELASAPRGRFDAQDDHLWFAEYGANRIAEFDPKTATQFHEFEVPTP